jgi:prephenate dehydrogenase
MRTWDTVAIIGVGLIGGSIGLALRERKLARRVIGIGRRATSLESAQARGCVTETTTSIASGVKEADLVVVCTPVELIAQHVSEAAAAAPKHCIITDAGSTKAQLIADAERALAGSPPRVAFVGSHPIAGSEKSGPEAAVANLFNGRVVVVTPTDQNADAAVVAVEQFWESLGACVARMHPAEHDAIIARTSHLPHLVASALAATTPGNGNSLPLTGSGWADTTRIASGDPELWRQILLANRGPTLNALTDFETVLKTWRDALENGNGPLLVELLKEGKSRRDAVGS